MASHENYMRRCLDLALMGAGTVSPNPMVGAVIVYRDKIIGEGYTSPYGGPHAEVNAINDAIRRVGEQQVPQVLAESTLYVSLEPCAHHGKTPPCADLIVQWHIPRVYVACEDPFAKVNGLGIKKLRDAGTEVHVGLLSEEAKWLNRRFFTRIGKFRPYVILKWAETSDGFFAPADGSQRWITNAASKQLVHRWRAEEDAVLVGARTALADNPSLTVREWAGRNPKRILIDRDLSVPQTAALYNAEADTIVFNAQRTDRRDNVTFIALENYPLYLPQNILYQLYLMDVQSLIVEGGAATLKQFIDAGLWDEARIFRSPQVWGSGIPSPVLQGKQIEVKSVSTDELRIMVNG